MHYGLYASPGPPEACYTKGAAGTWKGQLFRRGVPKKVPWSDLEDMTHWRRGGAWMRGDFTFRALGQGLARRGSGPVLVIRDAGLGDVVMASAAVRCLARELPGRVVFVTGRRYAPLFRGDWEALGVSWIEEVRGRYEAAIDLRMLAERSPRRNSTDRKAIFAQALGVTAPDPASAPIFSSQESVTAVNKLLGPYCGEQLALVCPRSMSDHRSFTPALTGQLCEAVAAEGLIPIVAGGKLDDAPPVAFDVSGRTDVAMLAELMRRAAVVFTSDSGPLHLSAALSRPTIAFFNEVDPRLRCEGYRTTTIVNRSGPQIPMPRAELDGLLLNVLEGARAAA
jgi:hypothetical protein